MKKLVSIIALILCLCTIVSALPVAAVNVAPTDKTVSAVNASPTVIPASYSYNGYTTYTMADSTLRWAVANSTEGGTTCTAVQGMNTGTTYCYVAKRNSDDTYADITRINMNTGDQTVMNYYASTSATSSSACNVLGHANELSVVGINDVNYLFSCTLVAGTALSRLQISGTKIMFTGYFDLVTTAGTSVSTSAVAHVKTTADYIYFLAKRGNDFYTLRIPCNATGGTKSNPTKITIYKIFTIDTRNAVFAKSNSSAGTYAVDDWTNQGVGYNKTEKVLYVPIWDSNTDNRNIIITYNLSDIESMMDVTANQSKRYYPTKTSFMLQDTSVTSFEIESVGFRTGQSSTGDLKMYFNINCSTLSKEGVYSCSYTTGKGDFTPVDDGRTHWTTKYNANGGTGSMSNTYHINGISTKLRLNAFTRSGYTFAGWYLTRSSDKKWLYFDTDGTARWYTKGSQPESSALALYEDQRSCSKLSSVDGDTVTCYAQWIPSSTGTTTFYVQYDANGGTGTMADTAVVYGTSTAIRKNTFTRDGYVFCGWTAYRRATSQWAYKSISGLSDVWFTVTDDTTGNFRKTYSDGCTIAKTSSVDRSIITFYAAWSRVANGVYPSTLTQGSSFALGGTVESTTDMYGVIVQVLDPSGSTVYGSYTTNPYTSTFNLSAANANIDFSKLAVGNYILQVQIQTVNGATPTSHVLLSTAFEVVDPATLALTDTAAAKGVYSLGDKYFRGFDMNSDAAAIKALFKYEITVTDASGNTVADTAVKSDRSHVVL